MRGMPINPAQGVDVMATKWTPDQTFYPSPRMAAKAPPETLAYVAAFDPERKKPDAIAVVDVDPKSSSYSRSSVRSRCPMPATSCIISAGMPVPPACAPMRPIPMSSGAIWWCRAALLAAAHHRHQAGPEESEDRQGDRARGDRREGELFTAAHDSLRAGGNLCQRPRRCPGQPARRHLPARSRQLRRARPVGAGPRAPGTRL
jgi:hypothetical protein